MIVQERFSLWANRFDAVVDPTVEFEGGVVVDFNLGLLISSTVVKALATRKVASAFIRAAGHPVGVVDGWNQCTCASPVLGGGSK